MDIPFYLISDKVKADVVDIYGQAAVNPIVTRGMKATLRARILHDDPDLTPFTAAELNFSGWYLAICNDWDTDTDPQILEITDISVSTVVISVNGEDVTFSEVIILLSSTDLNTSGLVTALNNQESVSLGVELGGIAAGETDPSFIAQFNITVNARRWLPGTGIAGAVPDGGYTAPQIDALVAGREPWVPPVPVDFTIAQPNVIYTVPADKLYKPGIGKQLIKAVTGYAAGMKYKWRAGTTDLMPEVESTMDDVYKFDEDVLDPDQYFPAGTEIILEITVAAPSTTQTGSAQIKGDLIDA